MYPFPVRQYIPKYVFCLLLSWINIWGHKPLPAWLNLAERMTKTWRAVPSSFKILPCSPFPFNPLCYESMPVFGDILTSRFLTCTKVVPFCSWAAAGRAAPALQKPRGVRSGLEVRPAVSCVGLGWWHGLCAEQGSGVAVSRSFISQEDSQVVFIFTCCDTVLC